jgi:hypothetical protein
MNEPQVNESVQRWADYWGTFSSVIKPADPSRPLGGIRSSSPRAASALRVRASSLLSESLRMPNASAKSLWTVGSPWLRRCSTNEIRRSCLLVSILFGSLYIGRLPVAILKNSFGREEAEDGGSRQERKRRPLVNVR